MKSYLSYFILKFKVGLQYRAAALAGISTQLFFGLVYILVYVAFYESDASSLPMPLNELVSYLWLCQAFFALIYMWYKDKVTLKKDYIISQNNNKDTIEFIIDIRKVEISDFIKLLSSKISIIDIDIDSGNIDDLIVRLYEEYKI